MDQTPCQLNWEAAVDERKYTTRQDLNKSLFSAMPDFSEEVSGDKLPNSDLSGGFDATLFESEVKCAAPTGIDVLIIGGGLGGLSAALECHRKGHAVRVFERSSQSRTEGDMVTIGPSASTLLNHYPGMQRECDIATAHDSWMRYCKWTGEVISTPHFLGDFQGSDLSKDLKRRSPQAHQRPKFHDMLCHQLQRFGIPIENDMGVVEYYEDAERRVGGVVTETGDRFEADIVIAADGTNSCSHAIVAGSAPKARPTGRTIFRGAFPLTVATADSLVNETFGLWKGRYPFSQVWMGPKTYAVFQSYVDKFGKGGRMCFVMVLPDPDGHTRKGSWHDPVSSEEVLRVIERLPGWSEAVKALIRRTPPKTIFAWPLSPYSPRRCWHSPSMRVLQLGDAAHSMPPTAGNGATQAIEDAITIAACLSHGGKDQVTTAVKVHNLLRADRVSCCQLLAFINDERHDNFNLDTTGNNLSKLTWKSPQWLSSLNPEQYADLNYANAAASLLSGGPKFKNTNIPPGHELKSWTVEEMDELRKQGESLELTGDWS